MLVVDLGLPSEHDLPAIRQQVDKLLEDAISTLERLDMATALTEAQIRRQSEALREAIVGSVSHGLRTPLASILGSASILADAPAIKGEPRLGALAGIIVAEADRLNGDIQKLLDAATVSSAGVKPHLTWLDPADLVNAAIEHERRDLSEHRVSVNLPPGLPLVEADPLLIVQALSLVLDNAARYSPSGSAIGITVVSRNQEVVISVTDEGIGLGDEERALVFEKFYRGRGVRDTTRGSGLGLWIANAFVTACRGRLGITVRQDHAGTSLTMVLPAASAERMRTLGGNDE